MRRSEEIYREILYHAIEGDNLKLTQLFLAKKLNVSLSVVHAALKPLIDMNALEIKKRSFSIRDSKKILFFWASIRNINKDIIYQTRVDKPVNKIESEMPSNIIYAGYSGYKFMYNDVPADYSEVYVYADDIAEIKKRFPEKDIVPNLFVIKKDRNLSKMTQAQLFVDIWNLKEWYAKDFLKELEEKFNGILE